MKRNTIKMLAVALITALSIQPATNCIWPFNRTPKPKPKTVCVVKDAAVKTVCAVKDYVAKNGAKYGSQIWNFANQNKLATGAIVVGTAASAYFAGKLFKKDTTKAPVAQVSKKEKMTVESEDGIWKNHKGKIFTAGALGGLTAGYFLAPKKYVALGAMGLTALNAYGEPILKKFNSTMRGIGNLSKVWGWLTGGTAQKDNHVKLRKKDEEQKKADLEKNISELKQKKADEAAKKAAAPKKAKVVKQLVVKTPVVKKQVQRSGRKAQPKKRYTSWRAMRVAARNGTKTKNKTTKKRGRRCASGKCRR